MITQLQYMKKDLQKKVMKREDYFSAQSIKWRLTEASDIYKAKTRKLERVIDHIADAIEGLEEFAE